MHLRQALLATALALTACAGVARQPVQPAPTALPNQPQSEQPAPVQTGAQQMPDSGSYAPISPFEMQKRLGRGVNFGNALEAPTEGEWGFRIEDYFFPIIRQAGFDTVRVPIRWSAHALRESPYTIDPAFFERIDWVIEQALNNDLNVVINVHHYEELFENPNAEWDRFLALWDQIATRYRDLPPTVLFEVLNEPHGALTTRVWSVLFDDALRVIRRTNPTRNVIFTGANWGKASSLFTIQPPNDPYIIATFHFYEPEVFTHQGANWVQGSADWIGTRWEGTDAQRAAIDRTFNAVARWSKDKNLPVWMGEFGAYGLHADLEDRARWTAYVARAAEARGITWAYWEFGHGFGIYNPATQTWLEPLLKALIP
ncbi:MAG: glycoside hydrolase family 5 protein [Thermoflexales bacterium]|nr:glycoside hydrolase family 5 protein [Thermoflexales bacterium]